ncbi:MAG: serine hydrolase domain-containing protein [Blastomonas sp.]
MPRLLIVLPLTLVALCTWAVLCFFAVDRGWFRSPLTSSPDPVHFAREIEKRIDAEAGGNMVFVMIEDGEVIASHSTSKGKPVAADSIFQVASLSKWVAAMGVMALAEDGAIDLDAPVSRYLKRWQLPPSAFDNDGVTARRLLSHTAGLDDGLGYDGFANEEAVQSLEESLDRAADASPNALESDAEGRVRLAADPGSQWKYSGGGYTLLQLLIEEVSGQPFASYMEQRVFAPLGMEDSGYRPGALQRTRIADNFDADGKPQAYRHYSALAATALYTSADDLVRLIQAQLPGPGSARQKILQPGTLAEMRAPEAHRMGAPVWGLGTMLYSSNNQGGFIIGHDGNNEPAINSAVRLDPDSGDAIILLGTGNALLATALGGEWVFWKTGNVDNLDFAMAMPAMIRWIAIGSVLIVIASIAVSLRRRRRRDERTHDFAPDCWQMAYAGLA